MIEIPQTVINQIVSRTEAMLGLAPNVAQFHAYDQRQQPIPEPLTASQYAEWLLKTNSERPHAQLATLAQRYRDAFTSQRSAIGITPGQLAHLAIAADVLEWLVRGQQTAVMPQPSMQPPLQTAATQPTVQPAPPAPQHADQPIPELTEDLQLLRTQLLGELGLATDGPNSTVTNQALQAAAEKQLNQKTAELTAMEQRGAITPHDREIALAQTRREMERRTIELQSIEARMHVQNDMANGGAANGGVNAGATPTTPLVGMTTPADHTQALTTLRKQEQDVIAQMDAMEKILDDAGLPPQELQHIRHQLHAVEELMRDIATETAETK